MRILREFFYRPLYVLIFCGVFLLVNLVFEGALFQVFRLNRDLIVLKNRVKLLESKNYLIKEKIKRSADPEIIEQEARERLDFANENDLIFIFPQDI